MNYASSCRQKLISLFLVITLLFTLVPATVNADASITIDVDFSAACSVQNDLSMVYYCKINTPGDFTNIRLRVQKQTFQKNDPVWTWETTVITDYTYDASTGYYRFVFKGIAAADMSNKLKATLLCNIGGQAYQSETNEISVQLYIKALLGQMISSTKESDKILCRLAVDMLNYGTAAQKYFQRNQGNLANSVLSDEEKALASNPATSMNSILSLDPNSGSTVSFTSVSLTLQSTVDLVTYATFPGTPGSNVYAEVSYTGVKGTTITSRVDAKDFQSQGNNSYRIVFKNITALYFRTPLKVVIKDGNKAISPTLNYSYESYAADTLAQSSNETLKDVVKSMIFYGDSAYAYFTCVNGGSSSGDENEISTYKNSKYTTDMPQAVIVIPAMATSEEQYAAGLLQLYIQREDGYQPAIITDATAQGSRGFEISVGNTNRPHGTAKYSSDGSYKIKSYNNGISITGVGKRGTIDASAKFLSLCGGYFWLSFEDEYKTNQTHFKYSSDIDYDYERPFVFTDIDAAFWHITEGEKRMFDIANGLNGYFANYALSSNTPGYMNWYLYDPVKAHYEGGIKPGQVHTMLYEYFNEEDFAQHPEWFSLVNGKRQNLQPCLTAPGVYEHIRDHVFEILERGNYDPDAPMQIISLCQADNGYYCECSNCFNFRLAHDPGDVNNRSHKDGLCEASLYLDLCNKISKEVKDKGYTNVYIDMLAYTRTLKHPANLEIDDHVIVRYAPISRCYVHDCDATSKECPQNYECGYYLNGWADLCKSGNAQLWIWDYNADWNCTIAPYPNIEAMVHDIQYYKDIGVSGIYLQSNDRHLDCNTEFGDLRLYLEGVLLENPDADMEKEAEFFLNEFYGAAAPYIAEYVHITVEQAKRHITGITVWNMMFPRWKFLRMTIGTRPVFVSRIGWMPITG